MHFPITLFAVILITLALAFALVRTDIISADYLRLLPALIAAFVGISIGYSAIRRRKKASPKGRK